MDRGQILALWLYYRRKKRKTRRSCWVHPINERRENGLFHTLFTDLRNDETKFFDNFRMSIASFDELHVRLKGVLQRENTKMRNCIQPVQMLAVTLRYLASGCTFTDLHYTYGVGVSTASKIVQDVCKAISSVMKSEFIPKPTKEVWESIASDFETIANFPHCLGAVDGKHIRLGGSMYFNYKDYYTIVLMAVADSKYRFVFVDIGSYGKDDYDSSIFQKSSLWKSIETDPQQLPEEKCLTDNIDGPKVPYFFIGDEAFGLHEHLLRPYGGNHLTLEKRVFNYRLSRARRNVECAFAILTNKWQIFQRPLNVHPEFSINIVNACIVLHNFVRDRDGYLFEDTTTITGLEDVPQAEVIRGGLSANNVRNILAKYFLSSVGALPGQMSKI